MGPAIETFLSFAVPIVLVIGLIAYAFKDPAKRVLRYFRAWQLRDEELETQDRTCREQALREMGDAPDLEDPETHHENIKA